MEMKEEHESTQEAITRNLFANGENYLEQREEDAEHEPEDAVEDASCQSSSSEIANELSDSGGNEAGVIASGDSALHEGLSRSSSQDGDTQEGKARGDDSVVDEEALRGPSQDPQGSLEERDGHEGCTEKDSMKRHLADECEGLSDAAEDVDTQGLLDGKEREAAEPSEQVEDHAGRIPRLESEEASIHSKHTDGESILTLEEEEVDVLSPRFADKERDRLPGTPVGGAVSPSSGSQRHLIAALRTEAAKAESMVHMTNGADPNSVETGILTSGQELKASQGSSKLKGSKKKKKNSTNMLGKRQSSMGFGNRQVSVSVLDSVPDITPTPRAAPSKPSLFIGEFGKSFGHDVIMLQQNALKREVSDLYDIFWALEKIGDGFSRKEIDTFYAWWRVYSDFTRDVFEIEEKFIYPFITAAESITGPLSNHERMNLKNKILTGLGNIDKARAKFPKEEPKNFLHRLYDLVDLFVPPLLQYFYHQEKAIPPIIEKHYNEKQKKKLDQRVIAFIANLTTLDATFVILTRWMTIEQRNWWKTKYLTSKQRGAFSNWSSNVEKHHFGIVDALCSRAQLDRDLKKGWKDNNTLTAFESIASALSPRGSLQSPVTTGLYDEPDQMSSATNI
uniref:Uncharacterized protein n=1 Tax=Compsopogon caeruleus TaxID=31354 RepID=A0A7S1XDS8_9RHOD|mmetsp:Transcript_15434/g.31264  ORF Transcript_15434/g.31264 Transcript_15434/m.31264 type:complete len:621 (+) Transcript_15434:503-2365(+)|eukprot:CAMPEP_0184679210 /NCGR_PEP_ID=MMETSP0312-20130426/2031_1 /TAXON_ID=31354 /ORGANISM="Compsopogon coeruleus, Strain SAG 36.94" /LENGTH=620 /DNA_ID=CAMNT_0027128505 /DNA_START=489 /DNA_END=2351 /DNA_ORIENTATION=+